MPVNKNSLARCRIIDAMLSDGSGGHTIDEFREACLKDGNATVTRVTIYKDLETLVSGWDVSISKSSTRPQRYFYSPNSKTMTGTTVASRKYEDLLNVLDYVENAHGLLDTKLDTQSLTGTIRKKLSGSEKKLIEFSENPRLKHLDRLWELYDHIKKDQPLYLDYRTAFHANVRTFQVQPFFLKQYNLGWYLMVWCYNDKENNHTSSEGKLITLSLDRIEDFKPDRLRPATMIRNNDFDFVEYFKDIIGVTKKNDVEKVDILLRADLDSKGGFYDWKRLEAKPLHSSQMSYTEPKSDDLDGEWGLISLSLCPNPEFFNELRRYPNLKIISPDNVRDEFLESIEEILNNYSMTAVEK